MATQELKSQLKPNLLSIPLEIRNNIYRMVLTTDHTQLGRSCFEGLQTALLRVCQKVHTEAVDILQGDNIWIVARINASENVRSMVDTKVPIVSRKVPSYIRHPALYIRLDVRDETIDNPREVFVLARESIELFVRFLCIATTEYGIRGLYRVDHYVFA